MTETQIDLYAQKKKNLKISTKKKKKDTIIQIIKNNKFKWDN